MCTVSTQFFLRFHEKYFVRAGCIIPSSTVEINFKSEKPRNCAVSQTFLLLKKCCIEPCILRAPAVADALTTGRGAVIERSAGGAGQDCL